MVGIISFSDIRDAAFKEEVMEETGLARDLATSRCDDFKTQS